jgi:hypothetical protein
MLSTNLYLSVQPDASASVVTALSELGASLEGVSHAPPSVIDGLFRFLQIGDGLVDVRTIRLDQTAAAGAIELQIIPQPSERLFALVSVLRARDWERFLAEIKGHTSGSAVEAEPIAWLNVRPRGRR